MKRYLLYVLIAALALVSSCSKKEIRTVRALDRQNMTMVTLKGEDAVIGDIYDADYVIVGGSLGGLTAAFAACASGRKAILIEETDHIAACFADTNDYYDNRLMDTSGSSFRVKQFRTYIRNWYRDNGETPPVRTSPIFASLGNFGGNAFCFGSDAALAAVDSILAKYQKRGNLTVLTRCAVAEVITFSARVTSLNIINLDTNKFHQVRGYMFIDATDMGELLPMAGIGFSIGPDAAQTTGEAHAAAAADSAGSYDRYYYVDSIAGQKRGISVDSLVAGTPPDTNGAVSVYLPREPRRLRGYRTVTENDVAASSQNGPRAAFFDDCVGIGFAPIQNKTGEGSRVTAVVETKPFQIPLGAISSREYSNFLIGGMAVSVSRVAASAFTAPSVQMAIGEAAGTVSEYCAGHQVAITDFFTDPMKLRALQNHLVKECSVPIYWYDNVMPGDSLFVRSQMKPFEDQSYNGTQTTLSYSKE
jgi:hypothetical protein